MKKIIVLNGSPRKKGNTSFLVDELVKSIIENEEEAEVITLNNYNIKPCQACNWCIKNNALSCVQKDDMNSFYPKLLESDVIVFATPIYWFSYSAQLKLFIDRLYALHGNEGYALTNKKIAFVLVYGDSNVEGSGVNNAIGSLKQLNHYMKSEIVGIVHGTAYKIGDAEQSEQLLLEIKALGQKIVSSF